MITRFLDWLFPMRSLKTWGEELADWEAATEVWEPDELWAAQQMSAEPPTAGHSHPMSSSSRSWWPTTAHSCGSSSRSKNGPRRGNGEGHDTTQKERRSSVYGEV